MRWIIAIFVFLFAGVSFAASEDDLLPPEKAFIVEAQLVDQQTIRARWIIAEGYYLYRERIGFDIESPGYQLGIPRYPKGKVKDDPFFGRMETYRHQVTIEIPIERSISQGPLVLIARSQGCADLGVCYPPQERRVTLNLAGQERGSLWNPAFLANSE